MFFMVKISIKTGIVVVLAAPLRLRASAGEMRYEKNAQ
jgi:hypothetical protein